MTLSYINSRTINHDVIYSYTIYMTLNFSSVESVHIRDSVAKNPHPDSGYQPKQFPKPKS